jgi:hypothetical protein
MKWVQYQFTNSRVVLPPCAYIHTRARDRIAKRRRTMAGDITDLIWLPRRPVSGYR